ncbi:myelin and lymphocyte protein-like [Hypomesus transpacificus]|uniref:myelin and lymphocyte protein-like n=1 Tax=Hypomesus transpacificus TaxID=137520 RepID=UPI001F083647|nr:myelin and lymphocyte protein-like [Hypomesus transpacificus]
MATSNHSLPSGGNVFTTIPDIFFIPEFVFGGLVWCLLASTTLMGNPTGYVMFVSLFCFVMTTLWMLIFVCGCNQRSNWPTLDVAYHFLASLLYLSSSVVLAYLIIVLQVTFSGTQNYKLLIACVVMSYLATLCYVIHAIFSAIRWKSC